MVLRLLILHTLAYILLGLLSWGATLVAPLRWWDLGLHLSFYPEWDKVLSQPWSLVTYALPHFNILHFVSNMCLVYALLPTMEGLIGARHFLWAYFGGIVAGALAYFRLSAPRSRVHPSFISAGGFCCYPERMCCRNYGRSQGPIPIHPALQWEAHSTHCPLDPPLLYLLQCRAEQLRGASGASWWAALRCRLRTLLSSQGKTSTEHHHHRSG